MSNSLFISENDEICIYYKNDLLLEFESKDVYSPIGNILDYIGEKIINNDKINISKYNIINYKSSNQNYNFDYYIDENYSIIISKIYTEKKLY